jgi:HK97 family phage prohead protease
MDRIASYGQVRAVNETAMTIEAIASTEAIARDGAVILASAWTANGGLDDFRRNPAILMAHDDKQPPIGRATRIEVKDHQLETTIEFDKGDPRAVEIFRKVKSGFMRALSVRWLPIKTEMRRMEGRDVLVFTDVRLLEISLVALPADTGAMVLRNVETKELINVRTFAATQNGHVGGAVATPRVGATDRVTSAYERHWTTPSMDATRRREVMKANMELAGIMLGAAAATNRFRPGDGMRWDRDTVSAEFLAAHRALVLDDAPTVAGTTERSMDSQSTGYGLELIGTSFESEMWLASRSRDLLLNSVDIVKAPRGEHTIATNGELPEMTLVQENTATSIAWYGDRYGQTGAKTGNGKKFAILSAFSGELSEDSIIPFVPTLRAQMNESFRKYLGSSWLNGDTSASANANINLIDGTPAATKHYLAFDGMRHAYIVDATGQLRAAGGPVDLALIDHLRDLLSGDVGTEVDVLSSIDHSAEPSDLLLITDRWTLRNIAANIPQFVPVERITRADVRAGELGRIGGIRCYAPSYAVRTRLDGKINSGGGGTYGQMTLINTRGWKGVQTGGIRVYVDRVQGRDQYLAELYTRQQLLKYSDTVVAGATGITL